MDIGVKVLEANTSKEKFKKTAKIVVMLTIFILVFKELIGIISSFDADKFKVYTQQLSVIDIFSIVLLGIISYLPLSFYDFVLKKRVKINLNNKKLYKYSWIASSIVSIAGFGGSTALALKTHFYKEHVKDNKLLLKEISKIIALNLTGFSMVCLIYVIINFGNLPINSLKNIGIILIGLYLPGLCTYFVYKYVNCTEDEKVDIKDAIKIILISALEWITTINLIYGILVILDINITLTQLFPIFVVAIVVAMVSMSPGGIGSFDLSFMLGLQELNVPGEQVLLVIFLYRVSYYIVPLIIGLILYAHEMYIKMEDNTTNIISNVSSKIAYRTISILVFLTGTLLLIHAAIPNVVDKVGILRHSTNLLMMNREELRLLNKESIVVGFLLIAISRLISYKSKKVYKSTLILVVLASIVEIVKNSGCLNIIYLIILGIVLYISKGQFYRDSFIMKWDKLVRDILILTAFLILYIFTNYNSSYWQISYYSEGILKFSLIGFTIAILYLAIMYYTNKSNDFPKMRLKECEEDIKMILNKYEGSPMIHYVYLDDKYIYLNKDKDVLMQYQICSDKIFILGNPIGNDDKIEETIQELNNLGDKYGYTPVFCGINKNLIPHLHESGYEFMKLGEEARVNLNEFTLEGRKMKSVRNAIARVTKQEYTFEVIHPPFSEDFIESLKVVSDEWLGDRKERSFFIGSFKEDYLSRAPIAIVKDKENEIKGFANLMPMYDNETLSIDLMRFSHSTCNGVMDFMFVNLFNWSKEQGYSKFNMGLAPLSKVGQSKYSRFLERMGGYMYTYCEKVHSFQGLKRFKEKYCEEWDGLYMAYRKQSSVVITILQGMLLFIKEI